MEQEKSSFYTDILKILIWRGFLEPLSLTTMPLSEKNRMLENQASLKEWEL